MQPNQENNVPNRPVVTRRPINANARPVRSVAARVPVDAGPTFNNGPSIVGSKGGRKTGWVLAIILLLLIAAGGVGFGVWAYMDGNNAKNSLNAQIADLQQQNSELQAQIDNMAGTTRMDADGNEEDTADYIYVGEWGIKIKVPENVEEVSYYVRNWDEDQFAGTSLCVSGVSAGHDGQVPSFIQSLDLNQSLKVCLSKNTKFLSEEDGGEMYQTFPVGQYYIISPQAPIGDGSDSDWETESYETLKAMLEDENNRFAI